MVLWQAHIAVVELGTVAGYLGLRLILPTERSEGMDPQVHDALAQMLARVYD